VLIRKFPKIWLIIWIGGQFATATNILFLQANRQNPFGLKTNLFGLKNH